MQDHVGVAVPVQAARVFHAHSAEQQGTACYQAVNVVSNPDAHECSPASAGWLSMAGL
jgi:hypothetical protein